VADDEWKALQGFYEAAGQTLQTWLEAVERERQRLPGTPKWHIESRLKSWGSIEHKLARKRRERPGYSIGDMTDLYGVRVIVESSACGRSLGALVKAHDGFALKEEEDFMTVRRADGYRGLHMILGVAPGLPARRGQHAPARVFIELQIRTILQHQWSVLSHSEFYKQLSEIPPGLLARMRGLSEILECAEIESEQLRRGRALDECSTRLRRRLRGKVIERLALEETDARETGLQALYLLELEQLVRRTLVSDGDEQRRALDALETLVESPRPHGAGDDDRAELSDVVRRVRAVAYPLGW
jgi:ppGpp synthetase/RelA/SpoT-type nucleotidyltranferase